MNEIQYIGEHLFPGQLGRFTIILGFAASLLAALAYFFAEQRKETAEAKSWLKLGRIGFWIHGASVLTTIGCIFYIMYFRFYEYQYAQQHVSDDLEMKYILSAFWEGQEGSFLLWMFWHVILGFILIRVAKTWEAPVMSMLSLVQFFIGSMILGVYIFGETKIGANPLLLIRDVFDAPIFSKADYVLQLNGSGLNPLLQNYWMTIHPPTLFLGFASTTIPFCYAIAGLWNGRHKEMLQVAFPWALFSGAILGTGILMGGAWAYEALTFGGYWAWDPVENASLVPWIILIAGIHTHLVARATGHSIKSTYLFYILTFFFILYSTFLTRSGILGDTSVHAFTEMGLENQLLIFTLFFLIFPLIIFFTRSGSIPTIEREEAGASKEFWIFIGALVLIFSAALITASTSLPVYNKIRELINPAFDGFVIEDQVAHHNSYQLWIGILIGLLSGLAQYLRFKETNFSGEKISKKFYSHIGITLGLTVVLTFLMTKWIDANAWQYKILLGSGIFAIITNLDYLIFYIKGNLKIAGSAVAHIGFGLMIIGILASGLNKEHISSDPFKNRGVLSEEMLERNVILFKNQPEFFNGYQVTYARDTMVDRYRTFDINFKKLGENNSIVEEFTVRPTAQFDNKLVKVAAYNPDTKHYLDKDIFTHVATLPLKEADRQKAREMEDSLNYRIIPFPIGTFGNFVDTLQLEDSTRINTFNVKVETILTNATHPDYERKEGDVAIGAKLKIQLNGDGKIYEATPVILLRNNLVFSYPIQINDLAVKVKLPAIFFDKVFETDFQKMDYKTFEIKEGESINFNGYNIKLEQGNRTPNNPGYIPEDGDVAVGAVLSVQDKNGGAPEFAEPIFVLRGSQPQTVKDQLPNYGLHFQFPSLDPNSGKFSILIAQSEANVKYPVEMATNSLRTDYIVFEAIIFPGINFFWVGTIMMMLGLTMSWIRRRME